MQNENNKGQLKGEKRILNINNTTQKQGPEGFKKKKNQEIQVI